MAPPRKVPPGGVKRSILFREDQLAALEAAAAAAGVDASDVVRGAVDLLFPPDPGEVRVRTRAAFEVVRRQVVGRPDLVQAVQDGWRGEEPRLPLRTAGAEAVRLVRSAVDLLRWLAPLPPRAAGKADATRVWEGWAADWAGRAPAGLLEVLASPAARCWAAVGEDGGEDARPAGVVVGRAVTDADPARERPGGLAAAVARLVEAGLLVEVPVHRRPGPVHGWAPVRVYQIDWAHGPE